MGVGVDFFRFRAGSKLEGRGCAVFFQEKKQHTHTLTVRLKFEMASFLKKDGKNPL
jgi:hypothetical protein